MALKNPYDSKRSWEQYPHEHPNDFIDDACRDYTHLKMISFPDPRGWRHVRVTSTQRKLFKFLCDHVGLEKLRDKGVPYEALRKVARFETIKALISARVFKQTNGRVYLYQYPPKSEDPMIEQGLRNDDKVPE